LVCPDQAVRWGVSAKLPDALNFVEKNQKSSTIIKGISGGLRTGFFKVPAATVSEFLTQIHLA
jgi:hypothetical protein